MVVKVETIPAALVAMVAPSQHKSPAMVEAVAVAVHLTAMVVVLLAVVPATPELLIQVEAVAVTVV
jgi:hypothetical protein